MDWILNKKREVNPKPKKQGINIYTKPTLKYCLDCKKVWEISTTGSILFYKHMPTYGLTRKTCKSCNNLSTDTYKNQAYDKKRSKK
jgi:hypothetical protein